MRSKLWITAATLALTLAIPSGAGSKIVILQLFDNGNGPYPEAGITIDGSGNIFGTSVYAGDSKNCTLGCGEIFETSTLGHGQWTTKTIYSFQNGADGDDPQSPLTRDASGNLYGTNNAGNISNIYRLAPQGSSWNFSILSTLPQGDNVYTPAPLLLNNNSLFGLAYNGAANLFQLSEPQGGSTPWTLSTVFTFSSSVAPIWIASDPNFQSVYVSTSEGFGSVVQLIPGQPWSERVLYTFKGGTDGYYPNFVMVGADGAVYGTAWGGRHPGKFGFGGIVFRLSPPKKPDGAWTKNTLYDFRGWPPISLTAAPNGALAGIVTGEEDAGLGYVFELTPLQEAGKKSWVFQRLGGFRGTNTCNPLNVQYGKNHALYGVLSGICDSVAGIFEVK